RFRSKTFLRGAFDMGRWWRVIQLLVVALAATDAMVLLRFSHAVVSGKIVQPLLHGDKTAAVHTTARALHYRGIDGSVTDGIFGAVLVTAEIAAIAKTKCI